MAKTARALQSRALANEQSRAAACRVVGPGRLMLRWRRKTLEPAPGNSVWDLSRTGAGLAPNWRLDWSKDVPSYASELQSWAPNLGKRGLADRGAWAADTTGSRVHVMAGRSACVSLRLCVPASLRPRVSLRSVSVDRRSGCRYDGGRRTAPSPAHPPLSPAPSPSAQTVSGWQLPSRISYQAPPSARKVPR